MCPVVCDGVSMGKVSRDIDHTPEGEASGEEGGLGSHFHVLLIGEEPPPPSPG